MEPEGSLQHSQVNLSRIQILIKDALFLAL